MMTRSWKWHQAVSPGSKDKTITKPHVPLLDRRTVVLDHLAAILDSVYHGKCCRAYHKLETCSDTELLEMLCNRDKLEQFIATVEAESVSTASQTSDPDREHLGNVLFDKVVKIETQLCAQVTGMLLELDPALIESLLSDTSALQSAVTKAKEEYLKEKHPDSLPVQENLADALYAKIYVRYPHNAPQITGMLLELPASSLHHLLHSPSELTVNVQAAKEALEKVDKWLDE